MKEGFLVLLIDAGPDHVPLATFGDVSLVGLKYIGLERALCRVLED